ncbi:putative mismatch repair protein MSH3 [Trypanosoma conorhini]|uniref:Putative mismatch repair protein MSH3 n=1 Tax=Trypanosoma conorhini TaxID=83891 RepID=A0A3R7RXM7_9TRYP|nr:putative mismatch repair protein MSH3 [Trypanosoma conorhini]RNF15296.1 putative mismatch repair protein MSH3 [Trypanosoma conorhini]
MSKRQRDDEAAAVRHAVELVCQRPVGSTEVKALTLTPLEKQVVRLKESLPHDVVLMVACGYRVKFYGRDSRVASRRLGIMCIGTTPFESSSIPYVRVNLYVHRLVAMGYRVAFAEQENASIRTTDGAAKGIFAREVARVCSRGTLLPSEVIGDATTTTTTTTASQAAPSADQADAAEGRAEDDGPEPDGVGAPVKEESSELFMCFLKPPASALLSPPAPGVPAMDVTLVSFVTYTVRRHRVASEVELLDILQRYDIVELVLLSAPHPATPANGISPAPSSLQCLPEVYASCLNKVLPLHFGPTVNGEEDDRSISLSTFECVGSVDEAIAKYLAPYQLNRVYEKMCAEGGQPVPLKGAGEGAKKAMELPGSTLGALDVFHSSIGAKGSLLALLDHSLTLPGVRRLRLWLSAPPCDMDTILSRRNAVSFLLRGEEANAVTGLLRECAKFGDIEAALGKVRAQRCTIAEYIQLLRAVDTAHTLACAILARTHGHMDKLICETLQSVTSVETTTFLQSCKSEMDSHASSPLEYFTSPGVSTPAALQTHLKASDEALRALDEELESVRRTLRMPELEYRTIAGTPFIVDVPQAKCGRVPKDWLVLTRTKSHVRFHTSNIVDSNVALSSARERLLVAAREAWQQKQEELANASSAMNVFQAVIDAVSVLDAIRCLSVTSSSPGYAAPELSEAAACLKIVGGRHPVLDSILEGGYVSCDVCLAKGGAWILTGPNMGGKSALMRMVGTFVIMAQLGCYVPATAAQLPLFTAVYCRMGATDSLLEGASTFLKEMEETSRILRSPHLPSSLVLLDELGRGTSSFDGVSVAAATLEYLLQRGTTTLFVTHYTHLCEPYRHPAAEGKRVACYFMGFREERSGAGEGEAKLVFTYKPTPGVTPSSFGVRVARMAGLPPAVVAAAQRLSEVEERAQAARMALLRLRRFVQASPT